MIPQWAALLLSVQGAQEPSETTSNSSVEAKASAERGSSRETAIRVANVGQEYRYVRKLGFEVTRQSLVMDGRLAFDVLTARHTESGEERQFWFDITAFYARAFRF